MDIKILVAAHKEYWMHPDGVYLPLQAGSAGKPSIGYRRDDSGENISCRNDGYCELTALYWAWKNLPCEYIGLCHYRRYFGKQFLHTGLSKRKRIFGRAHYEELLREYDVLLPKKRNYFIETVRSQYEHAHYARDLSLAEEVVARLQPDYNEAFTRVMASRRLHIGNIFVMKREHFDNYCAWIFPILDEIEKNVDTTGYSKQQARVFGYLGERLFNVWLAKQQLKTKELDVVFLERENWIKKGVSFLLRKYTAGYSRYSRGRSFFVNFL